MDNSLYAAVDLGSNSFHMVIAHLSEGRFRIVDRIKEKLANGLTPATDKPTVYEKPAEAKQGG